jgi:hypothetical protein
MIRPESADTARGRILAALRASDQNELAERVQDRIEKMKQAR